MQMTISAALPDEVTLIPPDMSLLVSFYRATSHSSD
jgi:hypothetical protein